MSSFSPWGGLGGPGEACVMCDGNPTTLVAHAPTRGASTKRSHFGTRYCKTPPPKKYIYISKK
jgi:hypothetical protein